MRKVSFYLIRHAEIDGPPALYGATDIPVCGERNQVLAQSIYKRIPVIDRIYSSPLQRCLCLANEVGTLVGEKPQMIKALAEMDFGELDGIPFDHYFQSPSLWAELEAFYSSPYQHPLPEAERLEAFHRRIDRVKQRILNDEGMKDGQQVLVFCHGGVIRMWLAIELGVDWRNPKWYSGLNIPYGSSTQIDYRFDTQKHLVNGHVINIGLQSYGNPM